MPSGYGEFSSYSMSRILVNLIAQFNKAYLVDSSTNSVMSDTLSFTWVGVGSTDQEAELNVSGGSKVFTISQAGTVDQLYLTDSSNNLRAVVDLSPVVYGTPTYYTLISLTITLS